MHKSSNGEKEARVTRLVCGPDSTVPSAYPLQNGCNRLDDEFVSLEGPATLLWCPAPESSYVPTMEPTRFRRRLALTIAPPLSSPKRRLESRVPRAPSEDG